MISYSQLGKWGNLGNQLFEIASLQGIAKDNNIDWVIPYWKYSMYFEYIFPTKSGIRAQNIGEKAYHFTPEHWSAEIRKHSNIDITGWLQSEKYWETSKNEVKKMFHFKGEFREKLRTRFQQAFLKPTIAISIRRGDYVNNPNYDLLPISYYVGALLKYFPNYNEYNIFVFSDDIPYCRHHFECLDNVYYPNSCSDIEQLCLMSQCDNFIIANSTFSWWGAYIGEKEHSQIIRPNYLFSGNLLKNNDDRDFWPERWTMFDHKVEKVDMSDVTFTIPVSYDHEDRAQNLRLTVQYLDTHLNTNIIIGEQGGQHFANTFPNYTYINYPYEHFHRTKMLNEMASISNTRIIVNWDADVIIPVMQLAETVNRIRNGSDMVYPYDGRFSRVDRRQYLKVRDSLDTAVYKDHTFVGARKNDALSVGGAVFFKKSSFLDGGMENENFISYAPEDQERYYRFSKLGYKVERVKGNLYHMDHYIGSNSYTLHALYKDNEAEWYRIRDIQDLRSEIQKWSWFKQYSNEYYSEIIDGSTKSRDEIFKILNISLTTKIIDVGCGLGHWGEDLPNYYGVDYRIPREMLIIPQDKYQEYDLTSNNPFPFSEKFDICICAEVLEHIPDEFAEKTVGLLVSLAPTVIFSAAIPGQGGVNHVNEQWQTYWIEKFKKFGYFPTISEEIRNNRNIEIWYRNNLMIFSSEGTDNVQDFIHPQLYTNIVGTHTKWKNIKPYV